MAVVKYRTKMYTPRTGVCSTWLSLLAPADHNGGVVGEGDSTTSLCKHVNVWVCKGTIKFPEDHLPVVMVGPGTGCAPFRSFIQERVHRQATGETVLFFGCRSSSGDDFFADEWNNKHGNCEGGGGNVKVFTAYSRDQPQKVLKSP